MKTIRTPSRLHMSLIDMNGGLGRVDGGIGVALEDPCLEIAFEKADNVEARDADAGDIAKELCKKLGVGGIKLDVVKKIPDHVGFGSDTQKKLAIAAGICKTYGIKKTVNELAVLVKRGGTSGIGTAAFEHGGFILDGGHHLSKGFVPSGASDASPAPILARYEFPWHFVCAWPDVKGAYGAREEEIFRKKCPILADDVEKVSRVIVVKILPAIVEKNITEFGEGINMLQNLGFKGIEVGLQRKTIGSLLDFMQENSAGAGMSSFGPVCYGICESKTEADSLAEDIKTDFCFNVISTKANNSGAKWL